MRHLDLFSGIGTWALASQEVWPDREMIGFCEIDPFGKAVLAKHFPNVPVYDDVKTLTGRTIADSIGHGLQEPRTELETARDRQFHQTYELDLLTASPPCQAASSAGKRKGTTDDRWLWPETFRILSETRPRWFVFENVRGILSLEGGLVLDALIFEMESHGYEVWPVVIPASGVGAPHRRERVWFIGRRKDDAEDAFSIRSGGRGEDGRQVLESGSSEVQVAGSDCETRAGDAGNPDDTRLEGHGELGERPDQRLARKTDWERDWREVARELCWEDETKPGVHGVDDGPPPRVYGSRKLSESAHRRERLKACGNGIVGQVAVEIMKAIKHADSPN